VIDFPFDDESEAPAAAAQSSQSAQSASPSPKPSDPSAFNLRGAMPRVMRLSPKAMATLGAFACACIGGTLIYSLREPVGKAGAELFNTDGNNKADVVVSAPKDYTQVPKLGPPLPGDLGRPILAAQQRGDSAPLPPVGTNAQPVHDPAADAAEAARQRAAQEHDAARTSRLFLAGASTGNSSLALPETVPPRTAGGFAAPEASARAATGQAGKRAFLTQLGDKRIASVERLQAPLSPNILQAGTIIPAALITGIRSDLPGQITAQVTQSVYDSPTGHILLIPQGARLIGEYDSEVDAGQHRVLLVWTRLILPGGSSILLDRLPGADGAGFAGLQDGVNLHWGGVARAALISTLLGAGAELGKGSNDDLVLALRRGGQDSVAQAGQQIVRRELGVRPTLTIRPGFPLRIIVIRDIILDPPGAGQ
jgi:type IV secretory pathway VirB10-like protein